MKLKCASLACLMVLIAELCYAEETVMQSNKLPIIYSGKYNISILGIENFHPFDTKKYKKVNSILQKNLGKPEFYKPHFASEEELLLVHTPEYLQSLRKSSQIAKIVEISALRYLPAFFLRSSMLKPMLLATGGTILGVDLALKYGWAINLSGGYHHAKAAGGEGFCVYADVPIALHSIWQKKPDLKALIIDLDAHQGNGNSSALAGDARVVFFDIFNHSIYPQDKEAEAHVQYLLPISTGTKTEDYLQLLKKWLPIALEKEKPDIIIYNAGVDIYEHDPLGRLSVSEAGIIERDNYVFSLAIENEIPILKVLSGGYHKDSGKIIAHSILHLIKTNKLITRLSAY